MTSVKPRRPVARRLRRRMAAGPTSVRSTRAPRARSHTNTRRAASLKARSILGGGLPVRRDAATGLRVIDAVVIHPGDAADEFGLHLVDLLERNRRLVELALAELGADDVTDRFLDLLGR